MEIKKAVFVVSNSDYRKCPDGNLPEYAFIGRSNVGKSSLINMLTQTKGLAKTSSQPGKTQLINHFLIDNQWYVVDLPGYGFARTSKTNRSTWQKMIADYLLKREQLVSVFVLVDSRIPPQKIDIEFINFLGTNGVPLSIVFTKIDKPKQRELFSNLNTYKATLAEYWEEIPPIMLTSSTSGYGRETILDYIEKVNDGLSNND